jgi:gingipain R
MNRKSSAVIVSLAMVSLAVIGWLALDGARQGSISIDGTNQLMGYLGAKKAPEVWVSTGGVQDEPAIIQATDVKPGTIILDFKLPGFTLAEVDIAGHISSRIGIPGMVKIQDSGLPELPYLATSLIIPNQGTPQFKVTEHVVREMKILPVEPSLGHLTRNINPDFVIPEFSTFYDKGGVWPAEAVDMGEPFIIRDLRGLNVKIQPLRYDSSKGILYITERLVVEVTIDGIGGENQLSPVPGQAAGLEFEPVYRKLFSNKSEDLSTDKYTRLQTGGRMLIICHDSFLDDMDPFIQWKRQLGIDATLVPVSAAGGTSVGIKQLIKNWYTDDNGLTWVILVGDKDQVPTNEGLYDGSDSDSIYALLAGDDLYPEIFISRISAQTSEQVQTQVAKFLDYEMNPDFGAAADWYGRAAGIASDEGAPADYQRADWLRIDLLDYDFIDVERIYQGLGGTTSQIKASLEEGCSLVNYLGHGTGTSWTSVPFSIDDVKSLDNAGHWPWVIDVSCTNGDFNLDECFAEAWLRAGTPDNPRGGLGVIAATSLAPWVPPTVMQAEVVDLLTTGQENSLGSLYYSGLMKMLDVYAGVDVAQWVMEQNVIFGDCSLMVRTRAPDRFQFDNVIVPPGHDATNWATEITGPEGSSVTLVWDGIVYGTGFLDAAGHVDMSLTRPLTDQTLLLVTIAGFNMAPYINTLTVGGDGSEESATTPAEEDGDPVPALSAEVKLLGNFPNPFNPETRIAFEIPAAMEVNLTVYDIRGRQVKTIVDGMLEAGHHEMTWDGRDSGGRISASGVYLYNLVTRDGRQQGRMVLSK